MEILVTHLTRMSEGYICVAGMDRNTHRHIRPVIGGRLSKNLLRINGGIIEMGGICDIGEAKPTPQVPEVEDHFFEPANLKHIGFASQYSFSRVLDEVKRKSFREIFGADFLKRGPKSGGVDKGKGIASLGVFEPRSPIALYTRAGVGGRKNIRCAISDGSLDVDLGVTDIRLYSTRDHVTPDEPLVARLSKRIAQGEPVLLCVGLTRATTTPGYPPVHWLQVNNIHFKSSLNWHLGSEPS